MINLCVCKSNSGKIWGTDILYIYIFKIKKCMLHYFITFKAIYLSFATDKAVNEILNFLG